MYIPVLTGWAVYNYTKPWLISSYWSRRNESISYPINAIYLNRGLYQSWWYRFIRARFGTVLKYSNRAVIWSICIYRSKLGQSDDGYTWLFRPVISNMIEPEWSRICFNINMGIRLVLWTNVFLWPTIGYTGLWILIDKSHINRRYGYWMKKNLFYYMLLLPMMHLLGPACIKLGQWASTRADLLPTSIIETLSLNLHHNAPVHQLEWTRMVLEKDFGIPLEKIFSEFDAEPIGSGSIAQVHRAVLLSNNEAVAVKVLHPNVEELLKLDCDALYNVSIWITDYFLPIMKWIQLSEQVKNFTNALKQQVDLEMEAHNLLLFRYHFRNEPTVEFPAPYLPWISKRVLVEEFITGSKLEEFMIRNQGTTGAYGSSYTVNREIVKALFRSFIKMSLLDNFVHADLHPGNILITSDLKLIFLDVGLINQLNPVAFDNFLELFKYVVLYRDGFTAGRLLLERGQSDINIALSPNPSALDHLELEEYLHQLQPDVIDPVEFCHSVHKIVRSYFTSHPPPLSLHMPLEKYEIGPVINQMFQAIRNHHVKLDPQYANLMMSVTFIEGLGRQLCPDLDLLPFFKQAAVHYFLFR
jgi:aarF domain-containing kinase